MSNIFTHLLSPTLHTHLGTINLEALSRIPTPRLLERAIPNIHAIELVTGPTFDQTYDPLYVQMFPHRSERERSDLIVTRLAAQDAGARVGLAPYRIIGLRDSAGDAIGAAHISVLPLPGGDFAVPYLQYIYVREANRRQDLSEVLHTLVLGVAAADAAKMGGRSVPFTFFETEPPGHGEDELSRAFSRARAKVHANSGGTAIVLVPEDATGTEQVEDVLSAHVQPGLEPDDPPLTLVWVVRPSPAPGRAYNIAAIGKHLVAAYYQSLRDEGFPEKNIRVAEEMVAERWKGRVCRLVPLDGVKPLENWIGP